MPWPGLRAQPDQVGTSEPSGMPSKAIASSRSKRVRHRSDLPHNADEKAKNLHVLNVLHTHLDFWVSRIICFQRKFVPAPVDPLQRGVVLNSYGGNCPIRHLALRIKHGYVSINDASALHAGRAHAS